MHRLSHAVLILCFALCLLPACSLFDRPETMPAYVAIRNPRVELDSVTGFSSNIGLRSVWFYHAGQLADIHRIHVDSTVVFPLIDIDRTDFFMEGGVYETGQSAFNIPYPFWEPASFTAQLQSMDTLVVEPYFEYIEPRFYDLFMNEGFEGGSVDLVPFSLGLTQPDSTFIRLRNTDVFHGSGMGYVNFGPGDRYFEAITSAPFLLVRGAKVFAEITYKNSMAFTVGLVYLNSNGLGAEEVITLSPSAEWNTVYINLVAQVRGIVNLGGADTDFWLWIKADGEGEDGYIALDDVRVLQEK